MKEALTPVARLFIDEDRILKVIYADGATINTESIKTVFTAMQRLSDGAELPVLVDVRNYYTITRDASQYAISHLTPRLATAILTRNVAYKLFANLYAGFRNYKPPIQVFTSEQKALQWLAGFTAK
jgi:hypothetical protein